MKQMIAVSMFLAPLLTLPGRALSAVPAPDEDAARTTPRADDLRQDARAEALAGEFSVPKDEIESLRAQGLGWGEIRNALAIARKAGAPVADVVKLRQSGMGWGRIARQYGFSLGSVEGRLRGRDRHRERRDMDRDAPREEREERAEKEHARRMEHEPASGGEYRGR